MRSNAIRRASLSCTGAAAIALLGLGSPAIADDGWKRVAGANGIEVFQQEVPGRGLPRFRGVGEIAADPAEVLAVLDDVERSCEWVPDCMESRVLHRESDARVTYYSRTDSPWPVADRDVVVRSETRVVAAAPERTIERRFEATAEPAVEIPKGVERMQTMRGHYRLTALGPDRTRVEYQVDADPGGSLPHSLVRSASKDNPIRTIEALRTQVERTRGSYAEFVTRWSSEDPGASDPTD